MTYKALTKDSEHWQDFKRIKITKNFGSFTKLSIKKEFYCKIHMRTRLENLCKNNVLVDAFFSGTGFTFGFKKNLLVKCKECDEFALYFIERSELY